MNLDSSVVMITPNQKDKNAPSTRVEVTKTTKLMEFTKIIMIQMKL